MCVYVIKFYDLTWYGSYTENRNFILYISNTNIYNVTFSKCFRIRIDTYRPVKSPTFHLVSRSPPPPPLTPIAFC